MTGRGDNPRKYCSLILGNKTTPPPPTSPCHNSSSRCPHPTLPHLLEETDPQLPISGFPRAGRDGRCQDRRCSAAIHLFRQCIEKDTSGDLECFKRHPGGPREPGRESNSCCLCEEASRPSALLPGVKISRASERKMEMGPTTSAFTRWTLFLSKRPASVGNGGGPDSSW